MPARLSVPMRNVQNVIGIVVRRPPMRRMSKVFVAWFTDPLPRKSSALKKACVKRWKIADGVPEYAQRQHHVAELAESSNTRARA